MHPFIAFLRRTDEQTRIVFSGLTILLALVLTSLLTKGLTTALFGRGAADWSLLAARPRVFMVVQVCQFAGVYLFPAVWLSWLYTGSAGQFIRAGTLPRRNPTIMFLFGFLLLIPVVPWLSDVNYQLVQGLPDGITQWILDKEKLSAALVQGLLAGDGLLTLARNMLVLAIFPALGEEILYRGIVQQHLTRLWNRPWVAILVAGALFSAMHVQFAGFLPRFALGIFLGCAFHFGKSLWLPVSLHLLNNALVVLLAN